VTDLLNLIPAPPNWLMWLALFGTILWMLVAFFYWRQCGRLVKWHILKYDYHRGKIILPAGAPFDGKPVEVLTNTGIVEAWWMDWEHGNPDDPSDGDGWCWVCYDDAFQVELDDVKAWRKIII